MTAQPIQNHKTLCVMYCGGTFGCHGQPLSPLPESDFIPVLSHCVESACSQLERQYQQVNVTSYHVIDSSQLTPSDLAGLYQFVYTQYTQGVDSFLIIQGTDTLSYTAAFLAYAFAHVQDIAIQVTGSMQPLLHVDAPLAPCVSHEATPCYDSAINTSSDALDNLRCALHNMHRAGVCVSFSGVCLPAENTQKVQSHKQNAFVGHIPSRMVVASAVPCVMGVDELSRRLGDVRIASYYCLPQSCEHMACTLSTIIATEPDALILLGYGAGNVPLSSRIASLITQATQSGILCVVSTQVAFGGVSAAYAAGSWLADAGVLSGEDLSVPSIYAKLLWLCANVDDRDKRASFW